MQTERSHGRFISILTFLLSMGFYVAFAIIDGAVICVDSPSYIEMSISREPLYPTYLALFRAIFGSGGNTYLNAAAIGQCILAGFCTWTLIDFITKKANLKPIFEMLFLGICVSVSLLCRFVAERGSMYNTSILTESLCIPLIMLFTKYVLAYCIDKKRKDLVISVLLSLIMVLTRKQMFITLPIIVVAIIYVEAINIKAIITVLICSLIVICGNKALDYAYNLAFHDGAYAHFNDNRFLTTVVFYVAEREDGNRIEDDRIRNLFYEIYDVCDAENSMLHSAGDSMYDKINHFGDHYDMIQIDHMFPMMREFVSEEYNLDAGSEREEIVDKVSSSIAWSIIPVAWPKMAGIFVRSFFHGIVNTVGKATIKAMYIYAVIIMVGFIALLVLNIRKNKNDFSTVFAAYTLLAIVLNVAGVSATIFCQVRYMIYMMPLFYIGLVLLGADLFGIGKITQTEEQTNG